MRTTAKGQVVLARKARRGNLAGGPGYVGLSSGSTGDLEALYFEALHGEPPPVRCRIARPILSVGRDITWRIVRTLVRCGTGHLGIVRVLISFASSRDSIVR